ncbi:MAG: hypothetical protein Q8R33_07675 [Burkholderiales bacterium]|nr:hypothetical protein [Burkholderiales bacterium]
MRSTGFIVMFFLCFGVAAYAVGMYGAGPIVPNGTRPFQGEINNPFNQVVKSSMGRVRTGAVTYTSFVRNIESVQVHGNTVFAMGNEVVVPSGKSPATASGC